MEGTPRHPLASVCEMIKGISTVNGRCQLECELWERKGVESDL